MAAPEEVYNNGRYSVVKFRGRAARAPIVLFDAWRADPPTEPLSFGETVLQELDVGYVCIKTARNDWYQGPVEGALAAAAHALGGAPAVGYGASMGAYASLNFASELNIVRVVGFTPQFSIDSRKAPFETRWAAEAAELDFRADHIAGARRVEAVLAIDPFHAADREHARLIARHHDVTILRVPFSGHQTARVLLETGALGGVVDLMLGRDDARGAAVRAFRMKRAGVAKYWTERSRALTARGRRRQALDAARRAAQLAPPDDYFVQETLARAHFMAGEIDEAIGVMQKWLPAQHEAARAHRWLSRFLARKGGPHPAALREQQAEATGG